ncbi:MAG: ABC transporter ATP-binding protein [Dehalococcoidia bacterium]
MHNASLSVPRGALMALLGPSGGGKTTVLRLIAGFEVPDQGSIDISGVVVADKQRFVPPDRRRVGMVFQDYALFPHMIVRANVGFGLAGKERDQRVNAVLSMVGLTAEAERMPHELSGGQQQRVALARALAPNPDVVLLDEPFSNLDAALRDKVRTDVKRILREAGASAIFVTHDQDEAFGLADAVGIMLGGTVVQTGAPEDVYLHPSSLEVARFLGDANLLEGEARDGFITSPLGKLQLDERAAVSGPATAVIRPETVRLQPEEGPSVTATVIDRQFRGIYKAGTLRLQSGHVVRAVMGLHIPCEVGDVVQVAVNSPVSAFPSS